MRVKRLANPHADLTLPDFAAWIRQAREDCGLTQHELSQLLSLSDSTLSQYETGDRRITAATLYRIAKICQVTFVIGENDGAPE
jgi:transcriptional regulator with XRE-family HTH domain